MGWPGMHLGGGALHIAIGTENAARAPFRLHHRAASATLIKVLDRVLGHNLAVPVPADGTRDRRSHLSHETFRLEVLPPQVPWIFRAAKDTIG